MSAHSCQEAKEDNASSALGQIVRKGDASPQKLGAPRACPRLRGEAEVVQKAPAFPSFVQRSGTSASKESSNSSLLSLPPPSLSSFLFLTVKNVSSLFKAITEVFIVFKQEGEITVTQFGPCFSQHPFSRTGMCLALEHQGNLCWVINS